MQESWDASNPYLWSPKAIRMGFMDQAINESPFLGGRMRRQQLFFNLFPHHSNNVREDRKRFQVLEK